MSDFIKSILKKNNNIDFLFLQPNGKLIKPSTINGNFKKICKDADIRPALHKRMSRGKEITLRTSNVNTHMLRHTYATRCAEAKMEAVVVKTLIGHKDIETTLNLYTDVFDDFKEDQIVKLNEYLAEMKMG